METISRVINKRGNVYALIAFISVINVGLIECAEVRSETKTTDAFTRSEKGITDNLAIPDPDNVIPNEWENTIENELPDTKNKPPSRNPDSATIHTTTKKPAKNVDPMDQYLLDGLLNIVDEKFETLTKRLSTMERGIQNLQYYNVRSFRVVNTHLHAVDTILHGMNAQIDQVEIQNTAIEEHVGTVKQEVVDLQSMNTGMFQAIEQNLVHFHKDVESRISQLKEGLDKSNARIDLVRNDTATIRIDVSDMKGIQTDLLQNTEASLTMTSDVVQITSILTNLTHHVIKATDRMLSSDHGMHTSLRSIETDVAKVTTGTEEIRSGLKMFLTNISIDLTQDEIFAASGESAEKTNFGEFKSADSQTQMTCSKMFEMMDEKLKHLNVTQTNEQTVTCRLPPSSEQDNVKSHSKKLIRALSTVNDNIYQSVTLYKHTGHLIERVISDTELIANEQVRLREEILDFLINGTMNLFNTSIPEIAEFIEIKKHSGGFTDNQKQGDCSLAISVADEMSKLSQNATQLIELLTDLATAGTSSMKGSIEKLDHEINRINKVQADTLNTYLYKNLNSFVRDDPQAERNTQLGDIQNKTDLIYQLVDGISQNTGWIPYFFHNIRFVESQVNKTLKTTNEMNTKTDEILLRQRANMAIVFRPKQDNKQAQTLPVTPAITKLSSIFKATTQTPSDQMTTRPEVRTPCISGNQSEAVISMMEYVYATNIKLDRLIPALTNLLGEPEPYISLVNGKSDREGRLEIYHKGKWGTIGGELNHVEASYVCRKLGYLGGISAGSGYFGPGTGTFWNLNVTCLRTRWCEAVKHVVNVNKYDHSNDVGIICDHMIRLTPESDEEVEATRHVGKLEIYHQNTWMPVCYENWARENTNVICKQLGFREGAATGVINDTMNNNHWMTNVTCTGSETRLDACAFDGFAYNGCSKKTYASMICS